MTTETPKIYGALVACMRSIAEEGIGKNRKNDAQGFRFRGIDDVYGAVVGELAANRVIILPDVLSMQMTVRTQANGKNSYHALAQIRYTFVSAEDGSSHQVTVYGEGVDQGDKAVAKALSAAFKYACFQVFCIPVEGVQIDADETTPPATVTPKKSVRVVDPPIPADEPHGVNEPTGGDDIQQDAGREHDPSYTRQEQKRFNAVLGEHRLEYYTFCEFLVWLSVEKGKGTGKRPSAMTQKQRNAIELALDKTETLELYQEFLASKRE